MPQRGALVIPSAFDVPQSSVEQSDSDETSEFDVPNIRLPRLL
jgi:hypothetical protein